MVHIQFLYGKGGKQNRCSMVNLIKRIDVVVEAAEIEGVGVGEVTKADARQFR